MKILLTRIFLLFLLAASASGCATVFGGPVTEQQRTKPAAGEPERQVRVGALIADIILFWPSTIVDFATGAIYKPQPAHPPHPEAKNESHQHVH